MKNPTHTCKALGKETIVPRAYNAAYPNKFFFMCPFCGYKVEHDKLGVSIHPTKVELID